MFIFIYLLTFLTASCQAQSFSNDEKPQYGSKPSAYNKQWQPSNNYKQEQGGKNMNYNYYEQMNYIKPKQQPMGDAGMLMKSRMNRMQRMTERDIFIRQGDAYNREGKMPTWSVPRAKDRLYTGAIVPTNTEVPARIMKWSKYYDMPLNNRARSTKADTGMKMPGKRWSKDIDTSPGNRARVTMDNPALKLQVSSDQRSYNQDIPQFGKSTEVPPWSMKWSKYYDMPLNKRPGSTNVDTGMKMQNMPWPKDLDTSPGNGAGVAMDNPGLKLQETSARRSFKQDIPLFGKSTEVPSWSMKWSKYYDLPLNNRPGSTNNADIGMKMQGMPWPKHLDTSPGNGAGVAMDNPGLKLQVTSARRSFNQDIPLFEKSEIPTEELKKTLKNIDEHLAKYENGIYKLFKPNYLHDHHKLEAIKKTDLPIDAKVHTLLKTLKTRRKGTPHLPVGDISDISI